MIFVTGRCAACLTSLMMRKAKKDGMLYEETKGRKHGVVLFLATQLAVSVLFMLLLNPVRGASVCLAIALYTALYCRRVSRIFGGVTGDTTGYYLTEAETAAVAALAVSAWLPL